MNRRDFIKTTAVGALVAAVGLPEAKAVEPAKQRMFLLPSKRRDVIEWAEWFAKNDPEMAAAISFYIGVAIESNGCQWLPDDMQRLGEVYSRMRAISKELLVTGDAFLINDGRDLVPTKDVPDSWYTEHHAEHEPPFGPHEVFVRTPSNGVRTHLRFKPWRQPCSRYGVGVVPRHFKQLAHRELRRDSGDERLLEVPITEVEINVDELRKALEELFGPQEWVHSGTEIVCMWKKAFLS